MKIYLDTVIVIYAVEGTPIFQPRAQARMVALRTAGDRFAVSDLTWLECQVKPLRMGDTVKLAEFVHFLTAPDIQRLPLPTAVFERAARIRAHFNYQLADALHLAAAIEGSCDAFLINDARLGSFPDIPVEILP